MIEDEIIDSKSEKVEIKTLLNGADLNIKR